MMHPDLLLSLRQQHIQERLHQAAQARLIHTSQLRGTQKPQFIKDFLHAARYSRLLWAIEKQRLTDTCQRRSQVCCPNI